MSEHRLLKHGSTGVNLPLGDGHLDLARDLESLGYDTLWIAGGQLDRLDRVTDLLAATTTVQVATGIVPLGVYDTAEIAALHADLVTRFPGRFVLGLGGPQQARPMAALREHLAALDAAGVPPHQRLLAALGPKKILLAGERTAGAITLLTTPASTADTRRQLGGGPTLAVHDAVALDPDVGRVRESVRGMLSFLTQVPGYRASFARMGFDDAEVDGLGDGFVDALVGHGDTALIGRRVAAHRAAGADHVALSIHVTDGGPSLVETAAAIASELGLPSGA